MLGNVKVSRYEQRANREKKHIEARGKPEKILKRSESEPRESRFNFEGTPRTERRGNAENGTGRMMKNDEIPKEAKRKQRERRAFYSNMSKTPTY